MTEQRPDDGWTRIGFEVELLAPVGASRATLAAALARSHSGTVRTIFHHDTEPTMVKDRAVFHHLTRGFEVLGPDGDVLCRLVDDVTIQNDLDQATGPVDDWYRILSDDARLLRLIEQLADPEASGRDVLIPVAEAFGAKPQALDGGRFRLDDRSGATVAMAAPQGGQRERVCELITPPLATDHHRRLEALLEPARALGFTVPAEAAVHAHLDAAPFRSAAALARLVRMLAADRQELWQALGTNRRCRRLGPLPEELVSGVDQPGFAQLPWPETVAWLGTLPLTKFSDCNLLALRFPIAETVANATPDTVEVRILPGADNGETIMDGIAELRRRFAEQR